MKPKITFKRILRECERNQVLVARHESKGLLYDFEVFEDGVKIATFKRSSTSVGYTLYDRADVLVGPLVHANRRDRFGEVIAANRDRIPTALESIERLNAAILNAKAYNAEREEVMWLGRLSEYAEQMFALIVKHQAVLGKEAKRIIKAVGPDPRKKGQQ